MDQFAGPRAMAAHLHWLMENPQAYLAHFQWRSQNWSIAPRNHPGFRVGACALCERLLRIREGLEPWPEPLEDAVDWYGKMNECEGGAFGKQWADSDN
jgi:hypothetical protein